ncbi:MAG: hypothetical protein K8S97_08000 [Anaerolineae bacterium]|nr:hypothetical protein [Anaerolineae bacterium]
MHQPGTLRWNPQGTVLAATGFTESMSGEIRLWAFEEPTTFTHNGSVGPFAPGRLFFPLAWSADGTLFAVGTGDGGATLYQIADN